MSSSLDSATAAPTITWKLLCGKFSSPRPSKKGNASGETSVSMKNYSKYSLSTGGKFKVVSRIDNTVVYLNVDSNNKDAVRDLLDELGY